MATARANLDRYLSDRSTLSALGAELTDQLERRHIYFGKSPLPSMPVPDLIDAEIDRQAGVKVERFVAIAERLGAQIAVDPALRDAIRCPPDAAPLLEIDPGYSQLIVNSRLDMTGPDTLSLYEINTDSPAMMTYTDLLEEIMLTLPGFPEHVAAKPARYRLTGALLDALKAAYKEWGGTRDDPTIAIIDWPDQKTASELVHTAAVFEELGCPTIVCDPSQLSIHDGKLHAAGRRIDIIQRRVLFPDFMKRAGELEVFLEAYRRGLVCVANSLRTIVVGNKAALALLSERPGLCGLSAEDRNLLKQLLPQTITVNADYRDQLIAEKDDWVLKCSLSSGGVGVLLGNECSVGEWQSWLDRAGDESVVAQRAQPIAVRDIPVVAGEAVERRRLFANWNPWVFGGRYAGASTRVSEEKIVSISAGGGLLPAIPV